MSVGVAHVYRKLGEKLLSKTLYIILSKNSHNRMRHNYLKIVSCLIPYAIYIYQLEAVILPLN